MRELSSYQSQAVISPADAVWLHFVGILSVSSWLPTQTALLVPSEAHPSFPPPGQGKQCVVPAPEGEGGITVSGLPLDCGVETELFWRIWCIGQENHLEVYSNRQLMMWQGTPLSDQLKHFGSSWVQNWIVIRANQKCWCHETGSGLQTVFEVGLDLLQGTCP